MREKKCRSVILLLMLALCFGAAGAVRAAGTAAEGAQAQQKNGWAVENGKKCYYRDGVKVTGFQKIDGKKYYFGYRGFQVTGWKTIKENTYYLGKDGVLATGWKTIKGKTYFFNKSNGKMLKGWQKVGWKTCYFGNNGVMRTGWQTIGKDKYYFGIKGALKTGFRVIKKKTYYFNPDGKMAVGWLKLSGKKYYFNSDGTMQTGWKNIGKKAYYFDEKTGVMDPKKTTKKRISELEQLCEDIVNQQVKKSDSTNEKIRKLFQYVTWNHSYVRSYNTPSGYDWYRSYAKNMLKSKGGNCYSYAAAFACLVKKATNLPVRVARGMTPGASVPLTPHGWCEVQIGGTWYVFDPDLYRFVYPGSCYYQTMSQVGGYYYSRNYSTVSFEQL